jgi:hypothetical protein
VNRRKPVFLFLGYYIWMKNNSIIMKVFIAAIFLVYGNTLFAQNKHELDSITKVLENIYQIDQEPRIVIDSMVKKFGYGSVEMEQHWKKITEIDSINSTIVSNLIDSYGWLSISQTSEKANSTLFLVIQHSNVKTREKYLPILKKAVEQGKAKPKDYAYLFDRTLLDQGKFQVYGSQLIGAKKGEFILYPIQDEINLNVRRAKIGLEPIEEYVKGLVAKPYILPNKDQYKNKIVVTGNVFDSDNKPLQGAEICFGNNLLISKTDTNGQFRLVIDKKYINWAFIIQKQGFKPFSFLLEDKAREVFNMGYMLTK